MMSREPRPETLGDLVAIWRRRASDRDDSAVRLGRTSIEGRILQADAAAVRQCIAELLQLMTGLR